MGRVAKRAARVQVSSRLTWTFSARATLGTGHSRRPRPVSAAGLRASAALLRSVLRAARGRTLPPPDAPRVRHGRHR
ncbi:hypothetical protein ACFV0T_21650 [Streptomyces sp. NPDC059582]|uniref:hypothetical protein n=1 Tax=Streptomyces sp. NPDC059582 TaxID=3346875 RepID=UPI0036883E2F